MKNFIQKRNYGRRTRRLFGVVLVLMTFMTFNNYVNAQCSLSAETDIDVSVDENCEAEVSFDALLTDDGASCSTNAAYYIVTIYSDGGGSNPIATGNGVSAFIPSGYVGQTVYGKVEYNVDGNQTNLIPIDVFDKLNPTIACYDALSTFTGSIATSDPTYHRTNSSLTPPPTNCNVTAISVNYDILEFTVDAVGTYTFNLDGSSTSAAGAVFFVALYDGFFDPNNPCDSFLLDTYAGEGNGGPTVGADVEFTASLEALEDYTLVTTTVSAGQTGDYTWTFSSTGGGVVLTDNPNCEYNLLCYENIEEKVIILGKDNCSNPTTVTKTFEDVTSNPCDGSMSNTVFSTIDRTYVATDESGNHSANLDVDIIISRMPDAQFYTSFHFPEDKLVTTQNPVSCSENYPADLNNPNNPSPDYTGWPYLVVGNDTTYLSPLGNLGCNLAVTYLDLEVTTPEPNCKRQIIRTWGISEQSCQYPPRFIAPNIQTIEIADTTAPVVACPSNVTVNTNQFNCFDTYTFPVPAVTDNCQSTWEWDILIENNSNFPQTFIDNAVAGVSNIHDLPVDVNHITYTITDACGNKSSCEYNVTVEDNIEPVAVCQTMTTVSLTYDGEAQLPAFAVNSGSYDNCSLVTFRIKRMETNDDFAEYVTYDCSDLANQPWMVVLEVTDAAGNIGTCMVSVEVQDKLAPTINCPLNQTVDCDYIYEPDSLTKYFGWPTAHDNCNVAITTDSSTIDNACYETSVKVITRNFTATDDGGRTDECTQTITFVRNQYFGYTNGLTNSNANGAITWPDNVTNDGCIDPNTASDPNSPLHPNQTGRPILNEFVCDQVGATYSDFLVIDNDNDLDNNEACFKIIRTWTVLDDCHKIDGKFATWYHDQVILITNSIDPTMDATPDKVVCTYDATCTDGAIVLEYLCSDDCTQDEDLRWKYYIDYNNDNAVGDWDYESTIFSGNELNASGDYPIGTHKLLWQVWDQCGNSIVQEQLFTIQNCKKPTPRCYHEAVDLTMMDGNPSAYMSAEMLDVGSDHTCGYPLVFSFSADTTDKGRWYGCNEQGLNTVEMWVTAVLPSGDTIKDYCVTTIDVQDNSDVCPDNLTQSIVSGAITTEDNIAVQGLKVNLLGSEQGAQTTNEDGEFAFPAVDDNQSYRVAPVSTDDYLNGLSTLDLVIIQKHILGIKDLDSPYKMLASDVNSDNKITSSDILTLRKLILGINTELPKSAAWKYMPKDYDFENPNHPYSEYTNGQFVINSLNEDTKADFIAIKVGDVNVDAVVNSDEIESRSDGSIAFAIDNKRFERNETVEIPVYAKDFVDMQGFQGTFTFDKNILEFVEIESGALDISSVNFATNRLENGYIPMSWYKATAMDVEDDAVLFTVRFNSIDRGSVKEAFSINSNITKSEAYSTVLENINLSIEYRNDESGFALLQNRPNPFNNNTEIYFSLPMASAYTLSIFDLNGKLIYETNGSAKKGMNTIQLNKESVNTTGVLYYTLSTDKYTATRKMVVIK